MSNFFEGCASSRGSYKRAGLLKTVAGVVSVATVLAVSLTLAGCGSNLRPTVTPIVGTGPAAQPSEYAFAISTPLPGAGSVSQGVGTVINYAGDAVMATAPIGPGPLTFALNSGGTVAWSLNEDGTVSNIPVGNSLQAKLVKYSTLSPFSGLDPVVGLFGGNLGLYALDANLNQVDVLSGTPDAFKLTVPVDPTPITMVGVGSTTRYYSISQTIPYVACDASTNCVPSQMTLDGKTVDSAVACNIDAHSPDLTGFTGMADAIDTTTYTISAHIPLGVCPVYALGTPENKRVFVLNRGSDTVSVINSQNNTIDACVCPPDGCVNQNGQPYTCHPSLPLTPAGGLPHAGPVYAEYNQTTGQLVVANYEGNSINIIDVSLDEYGNDSSTFGTTFTVPVGTNPASVTVLADGTRAYVANQSDSTVTVVNLSSHTVEKTIAVTGHPRTVVSIANSLYGKVYAAATDSPVLSIIRTDQDILSTTVLVQGNTIDVRINSPDASTTNLNVASRLPGAGQPCYLPPDEFTASAAPLTLANCQVQDPSLFTAAPAIRKNRRAK